MATVAPARPEWEDPGRAQDRTSTRSTVAPLSKEEQVRLEFFRSYDVMTGVRIAATLGGFFGMMVLLVLYKSRCRTKKTAIKEVRLAAAKAVVEEEDQQEAVAAAIYMQTVVTGRCPRRSVGAMSAPLPPLPPLPPLAPLPPLPSGLAPAAALLADAVDPPMLPRRPRPLPPRFSSLGGCSLLDAKVALSSVRRASMSPHEPHPQRHLHHRLHQHHQHHRRDHYSHNVQQHLAHEHEHEATALRVIDSSLEQVASGSSSPEAALAGAAGAAGAGAGPSLTVPSCGMGARPRSASPQRRAPLARISTIENTSLKEDETDPRDSYGSDSVFAVLPGADTDQDADDQLSTDSDTTTPHQVNQVVVSIETSRATVHKLFVLPANPQDGSSAPNLKEELDQAMQASAHVIPRQKKTIKVLASLESAASDEYSITPDQSQDASQCQSHDLR